MGLPGITYSVELLHNVWIPLRDGTRLAARVWMPANAAREPVPAVLEYLPYRKSDGTVLDDLSRHPYFAAHGYAAVRVDLRGTGDSDGVLHGEYLSQEQDDALEVLAWLERQPWCNGAVGMIGYSWGGFNGLQIAARRPSQLKAVISVASTDDRYLDDCHYMGGCLLGSDMLKWSASMLTYTLQPPDPRLVGERWRGMWQERLERAPELSRDWVTHCLRDAFWKHGSVAEDYGAIECPVMVVGGWADAYVNAVPRLLAHLRVPRLGIIGPWGHMMPYKGVPGPKIDFLEEAVRWWDQWLKGIDTGIMSEPLMRVWIQDHVAPATFYAERPGRWLNLAAWPPPESANIRLTLTGGAGLAAVDDGSDAGAPSHLRIRGRQECGVEAGVWCANGLPDEIAGDQRPDDERSLCFTTPPLDEPLEVVGFPVVRLELSADKPLALVAVRVEDVAADGSSLLVSWGMLNLTHRDGHEHFEPLECGRDYQVCFHTRACGHRFPSGHRVRLALSPTYWPHAWPSPSPVSLAIAVDGPSVLLLPLVGAAVGSDQGHGRVVTSSSELPQGLQEPRRDERSRVHVHETSGQHLIRDSETHEQILPDGVRYRDVYLDEYSIVEHDPLSASVRCTRETSSSGGAVAWRVTLASEMTCDAVNFYIREEYAAFEGENEFFAKARVYTIPRVGV